MVLAYHLILTCYGFWLPNDPRGSWSDYVRAWELFRYGGPATKVTTHRSLARQPHDRAKRLATKERLKYQPVVFNGLQARAVARGFAAAIKESLYVVHACAIMPDHAHLVIARHPRLIEVVATHLKAKASMKLHEEGIHPMTAYPERDGSLPSPWARKCWAPYLDCRTDIVRAIGYVNENPEREGLRPQRWDFVVPYAG